ncbi:NAD(P)H-dependent oxidoreductase [Nesterenkonia halophila]|uniref:NAD(P)H-dependent oxidoreductase n=1 Tax=Nesterenkonia halophila TaxID=302044 RepID=UPI001B85D4D7|nr:NAD(P)H-dependent oxidoreductase [Nesterenkonia halophila]
MDTDHITASPAGRAEPAADPAEAPRTVLWVSAHPEPDSLTGSLRRHGMEVLRRRGHTVLESDLHAMAWDPVVRAETLDTRPAPRPVQITRQGRSAQLAGTQPPDVAAEQQKLRGADALVVQFPLWWYGMPAILKGWFDRVFVSGFAFGTDPDTGRRLRFEQGPFRGTRALAAITLGDRAASIGPRGKSGELEELLFGLLHGTFAYTGMDALRPWALPSADFTDEDSWPEAAGSLARRLEGLFAEEPLPYREQFTGDYTEEWALREEIRPGQTGLSVHLHR